MNKFFIVFALMLLTLAVVGAGCQPETATNETDTEENETGTNESGTDEGATGAATDWCNAGSSWSWAGMTEEGQAGASWIIKGFEEFKNDTYCHVTAETTSEEETYIIDYYFKQVDDEIVDVWMIMKDQSGNVVNEMHVTG